MKTKTLFIVLLVTALVSARAATTVSFSPDRKSVVIARDGNIVDLSTITDKQIIALGSEAIDAIMASDLADALKYRQIERLTRLTRGAVSADQYPTLVTTMLSKTLKTQTSDTAIVSIAGACMAGMFGDGVTMTKAQMKSTTMACSKELVACADNPKAALRRVTAGLADTLGETQTPAIFDGMMAGAINADMSESVKRDLAAGIMQGIISSTQTPLPPGAERALRGVAASYFVAPSPAKLYAGQ